MNIFSKLVRWYTREVNAGRAEADLRAKLKQERTERLWAAAWKWVQDTPVCPECKTSDGLINWYQDGMEVRGNYCHDPHRWHGAKCHPHAWTYGGLTWQEALQKIGERLEQV